MKKTNHNRKHLDGS